MRIVVVGAGATGARAARQLHDLVGLAQLTIVDINARRAQEVADTLGAPAVAAPFRRELLDDAAVVVLAQPHGQRSIAEFALERGVDIVSCTDSLDEVESLRQLDVEAIERGRRVVLGAAFAPGLTCLLAMHGAQEFDTVDEIHVAKYGTGGPACARQHHFALTHESVDWRDGAWRRRAGGSGRELVWFPDPVGAADCYRAALPDGALLAPAFPEVERITARLAATRRDRFTSFLPMLRRPHPEGTIGAVRVELRGSFNGERRTRIFGVIERPAVAAGAVAAVVTRSLVAGDITKTGAAGLASMVDDALPMLHELGRWGVRAALFEGTANISS